jgi:hypothetical protein
MNQMLAVPKKPQEDSTKPPSDALLKASYNAGVASGRLQAIEESMDTLAGLIFKAEGLIASLGDSADQAIRNNANHTLRALQVAFAAVTDSKSGSAAYSELLEQSRQRLLKKTATMH